VRAGVTLINDSERHVQVEVHGLQDIDGAPMPSPLSLGPGDRAQSWCAATHTLAEWIEIYRGRKEPAPDFTSDATVATVIYLDPADTGVIDYWELVIGGTPVEPLQELDGVWRIIPTPRKLSGEPGAIGPGTPSRRRRYFLSKSRGDELPS